MKKKRKILLISACFFLLAVIILFSFDSRLKIRQYSVPSDKISENIHIVLVTDLHSCSYGEDETGLLQEIYHQNPDVILLGGDICDDVIPNDNAEVLLKGIADRYPCYYVTGNHEYWSKDADGILEMFHSYGVTVLNGTYDEIEIRGEAVNICGVSDPDVIKYTDSELGGDEQLDMLKSVSSNGNYTILLAHRPELIEKYAEYGFDLVLSGHAHGGQCRLPGIINGLYAPNQGLFPQYAGGEYTVDGTTMVVSRGLARESTRVPRIFNRPELVVVDIISEA